MKIYWTYLPSYYRLYDTIEEAVLTCKEYNIADTYGIIAIYIRDVIKFVVAPYNKTFSKTKPVELAEGRLGRIYCCAIIIPPTEHSFVILE